MKKTKFLTHPEYDRLMLSFEKAKKLFSLDRKKQNFKYYRRDKLIFLVAYECGLRASELSHLKIEDYNAPNNEMFCKRLKGSNQNTIRLSKNTGILLREYIAKNHDSEYIFLSRNLLPISRFTLTTLCKKYFKLARISEDKRHFHTIKHTTGVHLAEAGLDIKEVQFILGHKNVMNTLIYFTFTTKQQEALYKKLER